MVGISCLDHFTSGGAASRMRSQRLQKDFPLFAVRGWVLLFALFACTPQDARQATRSMDGVATYEWKRLVENAAFPASYNFPVHVSEDGAYVALHPKGTWRSRDGVEWTTSPLPAAVLNSAYMNYVFHDGGAWALGRHVGNYENFQVDPLILRTRDYNTWETVGRRHSRALSSALQPVSRGRFGFSADMMGAAIAPQCGARPTAWIGPRRWT